MTPEMDLSQGLVSVRGAAEFLAMHRSTIWRLMDAGEIPYVRAEGRGRRARRIPKSALVRWAAERLTH